LLDVIALDDQGRDDLLFVRRNHGTVAGKDFCHQLHRLITELVGLLDDCSVYGALPDARQGRIVFVEANDLDLSDLSGILHGVENRRAIVVPQADQGRNVRVLNQRVGGVRFGANRLRVVRAHVDDLYVGPFDRFLYSFETVLGVLGIHLTDEDHDLAAFGQNLFDQLAVLAAGGFVVGAEIARAVAKRRVAVLRDDQNLLGERIDHRRLIAWIDGANGDSGDALSHQVVDDAPLLGCGSVRWNPELDFDVWDLPARLFASSARDRPEVGG